MIVIKVTARGLRYATPVRPRAVDSQGDPK
jgi:hypothetical protein